MLTRTSGLLNLRSLSTNVNTGLSCSLRDEARQRLAQHVERRRLKHELARRSTCERRSPMLASCVMLTRAAVNCAREARAGPPRSPAATASARSSSRKNTRTKPLLTAPAPPSPPGARHLRHHDVRLGHPLGGRRGDVVHEPLHVLVAHTLGRRRTHPHAAAILERRELARQRNVDREDHARPTRSAASGAAARRCRNAASDAP